MTEAEFQEMKEIFKRQDERIKASKEYADELLTRFNLKHLLIPWETDKTNKPDDLH
jgi:hypothetical protein